MTIVSISRRRKSTNNSREEGERWYQKEEETKKKRSEIETTKGLIKYFDWPKLSSLENDKASVNELSYVVDGIDNGEYEQKFVETFHYTKRKGSD